MAANASVHDTILRVLGRDDGLERTLSKARREFAEFAATKAEAKLDVTDAAVARKMRDAERRLAEFAATTATADADVDTAKARADLERLKAQLGQIDRERATPEVNAKVAKALLGLQALDARLEAIDRKKVTVDVDVRRGVAERALALQRAIGGIAGASEGGARALQLFGSAAGGAGGNLGSLGGSVGFAGGAFKVLLAAAAALIPVLFSLGAALGALAASLGAAAAAAGALTVALGAAMGPALGVVGATGMRVSGIMDTLGASTSEAGAAASGATASTSALGNELKQTGEESEKLRAAQEKEYKSTIAVRDAREGLITALRSYREAVRQAWQEVRDAARDVGRVEAEAARVVRQARSEQRQAVRSVADAVKQAAAEEKEAIKDQAAAYRDLASAIRGVREAERDLRDARGEQKDASLDLLDAEDALQGSQEATKKLLEGLGLSGEALESVLAELASADLSTLDIGALLSGAGVSGTADQIEEVSDSALALQRSQRGVEKANNAVADSTTLVTDAQQDLKGAQDDAADSQARVTEYTEKGLLAYEPYAQALRDVKDAQKELVKATGELGRIQAKGAREAAVALIALERLQKDGIKDNPQVIAAAEGLRDARQSLAQATREAAKATEEYGQAAGGGGGGGGAAGGIKELTGLDREFAETLEQVKTALANAFKPATTKVLEGLQAGMRAIIPLIRELRPGLTALGEVIGGLAASAGKALAGPEWTRALKFFTRSSATVTKLVGESFGELAEILRDIAVASMPFLISGLRKVRDFLRGVSDSTKDIGGLRDSIGGLVDHLRSWLNLARAVGGLMTALFGGATAAAGRSMVDSLAKGADNLARWANSAEGQERIKAFFEDVGPLIDAVMRLLGKLLVAGLAFTQAVAPALVPILNAFSTLIGILTKVLGAVSKLPAPVRALIGSFSGIGLLLVPIKLVGEAIDALPGIVSAAGEVVGGAVADMRERAVEAWSAVREAAGSLWNGSREAISGAMQDARRAVSNAVGSMREAAANAWNGVRQKAGEAFNGAREAIVRAIQSAREAVGNAVSGMRESAANAWNGLREAAGNIFGGVRTAIANAIQGAREAVANAVGAMKDVAVNTWNLIRARAGEIFNEVRQVAAEAFNEMATKIADAVGRVLSLLGEAGERFYQAGVALIDNLIKGFKSKVQDLYNTVKGAVDKVTGLLPGSEPKDPSSPLRGLPKRGRALVENFSRGVEEAMPQLSRALKDGLSVEASAMLAGAESMAAPTVRVSGQTPDAAPRTVDARRSYELTVQSPAGAIADPTIALAQLDAELRARGGVLGG
jgi:phage-related protein